MRGGNPGIPPVGAGKVIAGAYRVRGVLGAGVASVVLDAELLSNGDRVAIKVFDPTELARQPGGLKGFLREAGVLTQVAGDHTLRVLAFGRLDTGAPYLVMEYLVGTDLRRVLSASGPMGATEAAQLGAEACDSLAQAHAFGLVHRQLRPGNLLLVEEHGRRVLKVANYLVGEVVDGPSASGDADASTLEYAAPEALLGIQLDARADVWSLGVILYELVCGERPYTSKQVGDAITKKKSLKPPPMKNPVGAYLPEEFEHVVCKCLELAPERRYADAEELMGDLAILAEEPTRVAKDHDRAPAPEPKPAFQAEIEAPTMIKPVTQTQEATAVARLPSFVLEELPDNRARNAVIAAVALVLLIGMPLLYLRVRAENAPPPLEVLPPVASPAPQPRSEDVTKRLEHAAPSPSSRPSGTPMQERFFQVPSAYTSRPGPQNLPR
jgi:serine/threonine-protein kinase